MVKGSHYFNGYKDDKKARSLCIFLERLSEHRRDFDETKYMPILKKNNKLLKKYNEIWEKLNQDTMKNI